jgi:hypothetical protein
LTLLAQLTGLTALTGLTLIIGSNLLLLLSLGAKPTCPAET